MDFSVLQGQPFRDHTPWNGGWIRLVAGAVAANTNVVLTHGLRVVPRGLLILDCGGTFTPKWLRGAAWTTAQVTVQFDTAIPPGTTCTLLLF